jgi:hypothetical protein
VRGRLYRCGLSLVLRPFATRTPHLQSPAGSNTVLARCLHRRRYHGWIVQPGKICDWPVPGKKRRGLELWRSRVAHRIVALGLLLGADIFPGCGVHPAVRIEQWRNIWVMPGTMRDRPTFVSRASRSGDPIQLEMWPVSIHSTY